MLFIFVLLIIFVVDCIPLIKKKQWVELTGVLFILSVSCVLLIGKYAGLPVPIKSLSEFFSSYGKKLFG